MDNKALESLIDEQDALIARLNYTSDCISKLRVEELEHKYIGKYIKFSVIVPLKHTSNPGYMLVHEITWSSGKIYFRGYEFSYSVSDGVVEHSNLNVADEEWFSSTTKFDNHIEIISVKEFNEAFNNMIKNMEIMQEKHVGII